MHDKWSREAAINSMCVMNELQERGELDPVMRVDDVAGRIQRRFQDRTAWNAAVMETDLPGEMKIFLIVPDPSE